MSYKNILNLLIIFAALTFFAGCQHDDQSPQTYNKTINQEAPPQTTQDLMETGETSSPKNETSGRIQNVNYKEQTEDNSYNTQDKRMIIRTGTMSMEVDSYDETEVKIELSKIGKVMNRNISGKDVTEEYMDADARLKTQRELESRLLKLLEEKTARLTDVVEVEQKLANVRENIEKTEGKMRYLKDQASYSTLTVSVYEPSLLNTSSGGGFFYELGQGVKKGLSGFTSVLAGLITVVIALLPLIIIALVIIYLAMRYLKKRKLAKAKA
jgi:Domain of unknown function (DUF4349)